MRRDESTVRGDVSMGLRLFIYAIRRWDFRFIDTRGIYPLLLCSYTFIVLFFTRIRAAPLQAAKVALIRPNIPNSNLRHLCKL